MTTWSLPRRKLPPAILASAFFVSTALMTACTPDQKKMLATGIGAVGGGLLGKEIGGTAGAVAGGLIGGLAGYVIADYLTAEEQVDYQNTLVTSMKGTDVNSRDASVWMNSSGEKKIITEYSEGVPLRRAKSEGIDDTRINQSTIDNLPPDTFCRSSKSSIFVQGENIGSDNGIYCRDAQGDYVRVDAVVS